jgi:hypothetical protein
VTEKKKKCGNQIRDEVVMAVYGMYARVPHYADPAKAVRSTEIRFSTTQYPPTQPHVRSLAYSSTTTNDAG